LPWLPIRIRTSPFLRKEVYALRSNFAELYHKRNSSALLPQGAGLNYYGLFEFTNQGTAVCARNCGDA
jgi:hypothetical protein